MASTIHRKDMSSADFMLLAKFSSYIQRYDHYNMNLNFGLIYSLRLVKMLLPVWYVRGGIWAFDHYKELTQEAIGIEVKTLRGMCRYLGVKECVLIDTLYRFSMLSVVPEQKSYEPPKYRMPFKGHVLGIAYSHEQDNCVGFVIEMRRAMGKFK